MKTPERIVKRAQFARTSPDSEDSYFRVYFIEAPEQGLIKIGYTADVALRFKSMLTVSPVPLSLLGSLPGGPEKEAELHTTLDDHRAHGEWFRKTPEVMAVVATATKAYGQEWLNRLAQRRGAALMEYIARMKAGEVLRPTRGPTSPAKRKTHDRYGNALPPPI